MKTPSLTAVLHEDFKNPPSGLTGYLIADLVGKNYQTLMSELSRQPGHKLGADLVLPLMRKMDSARALDFLAREMNGVFVPVPDPADDPECLVRGLVVSVREFGHFASASAAAIEDGSVQPEEMARMEREGYEAIVAIMAMLKKARAACERRYGEGL